MTKEKRLNIIKDNLMFLEHELGNQEGWGFFINVCVDTCLRKIKEIQENIEWLEKEEFLEELGIGRNS